jgi:hypothetical protein
LVHRTVGGEAQRHALRDWQWTLTELLAATKEFNPDGVPIAIDGLNMLASYLEAAAEPDDENAKLLVRHLRNLARANEIFERTPREPADFKRWSLLAGSLVDDLQRITAQRLPGAGAASP